MLVIHLLHFGRLGELAELYYQVIGLEHRLHYVFGDCLFFHEGLKTDFAPDSHKFKFYEGGLVYCINFLG